MKYIIYSKITGEYLHKDSNVGWGYKNDNLVCEPKIFKSIKDAKKCLLKENCYNDLIICKVKEIKCYEIVNLV